MIAEGRAPIPDDALTPVDVYKAGRLAAHLWRLGDTVVFRYRADYVGSGAPPVGFSLGLTTRDVATPRMQLPAFFAGLLPEGESRRRDLQRAYHLAEDDELGLLAVVGADTVGDVQVVPAGEPLPADDVSTEPPAWDTVSFRELWRQLPGPRSRSALPGVQPKMSAHSRALAGGAVGPVILKFAIEGWHGALSNERFFMAHGPDVGLAAPEVAVVADRDDEQALQVARFDRTVDGGELLRHAQEDATQVMGLRPGEKYDPDARTVVDALASRCASPRLAARDLFHQLVYSYAVGNNDVHAKNLSIQRDPRSGLWVVTPIYDVLHTWPYEGDHRFYPAVRPDGPHDSVTLRYWLDLAADIDLPEKPARRIVDQVTAGVGELLDLAAEQIALPADRMRDLQRTIRRRVRDLAGR